MICWLTRWCALKSPDSEPRRVAARTPYADYQPVADNADVVLETAEVVANDAGGIWVQTQHKQGCANCARHGGCGVSIFQRVFKLRTHQMFVPTDQPIAPGSQVVIGISQHALLRGALWLYLAPLLALIAGAVLGQWLTGADWGAVAAAAFAFWAMVMLVRRREASWQQQGRFAPYLEEVVLPAADSQRSDVTS